MAVAIGSDWFAVDVVHHEERTPARGSARIEDPGDVAVLHSRQGLAFVAEAGKHLVGVHAQLDYFKRHAAANGFGLLGEVDSTHTSLPEDSQDSVGPKAVPLGRFALLGGYGLSFRFTVWDTRADSGGEQASRAQTGGISRLQLGAALWTDHRKPAPHFTQSTRSPVTPRLRFPYHGRREQNMTLRDTNFQTLVERSIKTMTTIAAGSLLAAVAMAQSPRFTVTDLGKVGPLGQPLQITNNGLVAGAAAVGSALHGVLWYNGRMLDLGTPGLKGQNSQAFGVNVSGQSVGEAETSNPDPKGEDFCGFAALGLPSPDRKSAVEGE